MSINRSSSSIATAMENIILKIFHYISFHSIYLLIDFNWNAAIDVDLCTTHIIIDHYFTCNHFLSISGNNIFPFSIFETKMEVTVLTQFDHYDPTHIHKLCVWHIDAKFDYILLACHFLRVLGCRCCRYCCCSRRRRSCSYNQSDVWCWKSTAVWIVINLNNRAACY